MKVEEATAVAYHVAGIGCDGLAETGERLRVLTLNKQCTSQICMGGRVVRTKCYRASAGGDGLIEVASELQSHGETVPGFGVARFQLQRLAISRDRFLRSPLRLQDDAQGVIDIGIVGRGANALAQGGLRFLQLTMNPERIA